MSEFTQARHICKGRTEEARSGPCFECWKQAISEAGESLTKCERCGDVDCPTCHMHTCLNGEAGFTRKENAINIQTDKKDYRAEIERLREERDSARLIAKDLYENYGFCEYTTDFPEWLSSTTRKI